MRAAALAIALLLTASTAGASRVLPFPYVLSADRTPFLSIAGCGETVCALDAKRRVWAYDSSVEAWALLGSDRMERNPLVRP